MKTIGQKIDERVKEYKQIYESLKECGNPKPAKVMLGEAWINEQFVGERIVEDLKKEFQKIADKE